MVPVQSWDSVVETWSPTSPHARLRAYSDAVTARLVDTWVDGPRTGTVLKTDAFDESVSAGLVPLLREKAGAIVIVDVAEAVLARGAERYPDVRFEQGDVRALAYDDGAFELVVSNSTLDHFDDEATLAAAVAELGRVLAPGGTLVLTLDNPVNPLVATRNRLPGLLRRLGIVPYPIGVTCGPSRLRHHVEAAGLEVVAACALMHVPRLLALPWLRLRGSVGALLACERLDALPTRYLTGQFVAVKAVKR